MMQNIFFNQPLDQFDIFVLQSSLLKEFFLSFNIAKTGVILDLFHNKFFYSFWLLSLYFILTYYAYSQKLKLIPNTVSQYLYETFFYKFLLNVVVSQTGKRGSEYFIYIATLFFFILLSNLIGLIPSSFTLTSHIILTFMLGFCTVVGLTILGFLKQHLHFLHLFVPTGVPKALLPLLVLIEIVSYISRGFSLAIRLFANLMSGHSLLHILLFFTTQLFKISFLVGLLTLSLISAIFLLEIGIAFLQAYVFVVLISIYLKDSYEVSH